MKRLLRLECLKILPYRSFYIMMGLYLLLILGVSIFAKEVTERFLAQAGAEVDLFRLPHLWAYLHFLAAYLNTFVGVLVITLVCNEWAFLTLRQHVADGLSRFAVVSSKTLLVASLSLFITLFILGLGAILGHWPTEIDTPFTQTMLSGMGRFGLQTFGALSFASLIGFVMRRAGLAIACYIAYVSILERIIGLLLDRWVAGLSAYLPMQLLAGVVENPFGGLWGQTSTLSGITLGLAGGYGLIFHGLSYVWVARSDL